MLNALVRITLTLILFTDCGQAQVVSKKDQLASELIDNTELKSLLNLYETLVRHNIIIRKREPACKSTPACLVRWEAIQIDLLKESSAESIEVKKILIRLLTSKYSEAQLDWLVKAYKTPLIQGFQKFVMTDQSAEPSVFMSKRIKDKFLKYESVKLKTVSAASSTVVVEPNAFKK